MDSDLCCLQELGALTARIAEAEAEGFRVAARIYRRHPEALSMMINLAFEARNMQVSAASTYARARELYEKTYGR